MELINQEKFLEILNQLKNTNQEVFNNEKSKEYIDLEKAKSIIKVVLKNEKLNEFLISGFLEKYVEYVYRNKDDIENSTLNIKDDNITEKKYNIELTAEQFKKIISKIVIDDIHLNDNEVENACNIYEKLKEDKELNGTISYGIVEEYATFIYYNRYQIRKLVSKDLPKIRKDNEGNYILDDSDFIEKVNSDGGHNSPLWICIDKSENEEIDKAKVGPKSFIKEPIKFLGNLPEYFKESKIEKQEEKELRKQIQESNKEYNEVIKDEIIKNDIVVKNLLKENERETALIAEEIARQLRFPVAQYYPAKYIGKEYSKEAADERQKREDPQSTKDPLYVTERIVLTPNFLEEGEELITGDRIAHYEMDICEVPKLIREYFVKEGLDDDKIEDLITDYRVVMAYNCFINHRDCHNGNWGYIKKANGEYKISHIFDLEGSLDENINEIRAINVGDNYSAPNNNIDESIFIELFKDKKCRERVRGFFNLNLAKVFRNVSISKGITISKAKQSKVTKVIQKEKDILTKVLMNIQKKENEDKEINVSKDINNEEYCL